MEKSVVKKLPKVELHCHLDGSISLSTIRKLAQAQHISVPDSQQELKNLVQVPSDTVSLQDYLKRFDFIGTLLQTADALELAAIDVVEQAAAENVRYIELRFAPDLSTEKGLTVAEAIAAVCRGCAKGETLTGTKTRVLLCGMRQLPLILSETTFKAGLPYLHEVVVGGDFAGNEQDYPTDTLQPAIETAAQLGIPLTLHAGECHCVENICQAVNLGIKRIGHGTALTNHPTEIAKIAAAGSTIEMCYTSNLQTKAANSKADFPILDLLQAGVKVTINTDNRTVSDTTLTQEYLRLHQDFGITYTQLLQFNLAAIDAAFCSEALKTSIRRQLNTAYQVVINA